MSTSPNSNEHTYYYEKNISPDAKIKWIKLKKQKIGYIAHSIKTYEEMSLILNNNEEEDFDLPNKSEFLYLEVLEILEPYQNQGIGTKAFKNFRSEYSQTIIF